MSAPRYNQAMKDKRARDRRLVRRWQKATEALGAVEAWRAVRWLFAQPYNGHTPQGSIQEQTRNDALRVAKGLVRAMGGDFDSPPPARQRTDPTWVRFVEHAARLERGAQRMLLLKAAIEYDAALGGDLDRLSLLLLDMSVQQAANDRGWVQGQQPRRKRRKRRR